MIADIFLTTEVESMLHVAAKATGKAYCKVEVVDPVEMAPADRQCFYFLGVVVSGPQLGHYVVLRNVDTIPESMAPVNEAAFCSFHAFGNELLEADKAYEFTMDEEADDVIGLGFNMISKNNIRQANMLCLVAKEQFATHHADMTAGNKRKHSPFPSVFVEGKGELKTQKAQQAANTWIEAQDKVYFDKYKVHLVKERNIIVNGKLQYAKTRERYEYVESKTGRNFMEDVRTNAGAFNIVFDDSDFVNSRSSVPRKKAARELVVDAST